MTEQKTVELSTLLADRLSGTISDEFLSMTSQYRRHRREVFFDDFKMAEIHDWCRNKVRGKYDVLAKLVVRRYRREHAWRFQEMRHFVRFEQASDAVSFSMVWKA